MFAAEVPVLQSPPLPRALHASQGQKVHASPWLLLLSCCLGFISLAGQLPYSLQSELFHRFTALVFIDVSLENIAYLSHKRITYHHPHLTGTSQFVIEFFYPSMLR